MERGERIQGILQAAGEALRDARRPGQAAALAIVAAWVDEAQQAMDRFRAAVTERHDLDAYMVGYRSVLLEGMPPARDPDAD